MMKTKRLFFVVAALLVIPAARLEVRMTAAELAAPPSPRKKLIHIGWDQPPTEYVRDHWRQIEATTPFDGITLVAKFTHENKTHDENGVLVPQKWPREALNPALADLRAARFTRLTHNFVRVNSTPGALDWFKDTDWDAAAHNIGNVAWFARQAGLKGICFDPESYGDKQYRWKPDSGHTFKETYRKARERGAQVMRAIAREYPDITVWGLWLFSLNAASVGDTGGTDALRTDNYGLWPAFVNGWLDALPPGARLVDGVEHAYYFRDLARFADVYGDLRGVNGPLLSALLAPENRVKYQTQVSVSFGVYLDAYLDPESSRFYLGPLTPKGTRLGRLRDTLVRALAVADDYVWLYNEQVKWWPLDTPEWKAGSFFDTSAKSRPGGGRLATEALPGIVEQVNWARDPAGTTARLLAARRSVPGALVNLAANPGFDAAAEIAAPATDEAATPPADWKNAAVPGYATWQADGSKGTFGRDADVGRPAGSGRIAGVSDGCFIQRIPVAAGKAGRRLVVEADVRTQGATTLATLITDWATPTTHLTYYDRKNLAAPDQTGPGAEGWRRVSGVVTVPDGNVTHLVVLLAANGQKTETDVCWWDNLQVYDLEQVLQP
jgi:hypothetical protein